MIDKAYIAQHLMLLQDEICNRLEALDGNNFIEDEWQRQGGGGGRSRILEGSHIEKGGVNFSEVFGPANAQMNKILGIEASDFYATGVSIVLHPSNPWVPIIHMNVRYFEAGNAWWFGGGIDVTPHYVNPNEAAVFHQKLKEVCDRSNPSFYPRFKATADDYFYIKHRQETRGIGGIFFDRMTLPELDKSQGWQLIHDVGKAFLPIYTALFKANFERPYDEQNKNWQLLRRGRYVEFNLVWDKGTKFGLETDGRTESILMSLPKDARWLYDYKVEEGSSEAATLALLKKDINWITIDNQ